MALNDTKLRKIQGKAYDGPDELPDGGGLSARISPKGQITFQYRYRIDGKPVRLKLGVYGSMSLREAREAMEQCKKWLSDGKNPSVEIKAGKAKEVEKPIVSLLVEEWLDSPAARDLVKRDYWERMLKIHVTENAGKLIADDMKATDWEKIFRSISDNGSPVQAGNVLVKMKQVIRYALRRQRITSNTLMLLELGDVGKRPEDGERFLNDNEIGMFWPAVDETKMSFQNRLFVKLVLLTGCRGVELRLAKKDDFDLDGREWVIRKEVSKTRKRFVRGLSSLAVDYLKQAFALYPDFDIAFPPANVQKDRPMSAGVLISMADQVGDVMGISDWSLHDLRRTCKTKMAELGVAPHVSEKILGHKLTGMLAIYDQYDYIPEQQEAADLWANKIQECASLKKPLSLQNRITSS